VCAWHLWPEHPHRQSLNNPVGNIIRKLESGEPPPGEFLRAADEQNRLREWRREPEEHEGEDPQEEEPPEPEPDKVPSPARQLWAQSLGELQLQWTRVTFDTWLRGSKVVESSLRDWVPHFDN
jgi:hypothetical protein